MSKSTLEQGFLTVWAADKSRPMPRRQYCFHPARRWRFDFAWPDAMVAVEVEGGVWTGGRHTRGAGFQADCRKYNAAVLLGWRVLRYTATDLRERPVQVCEEVALLVQS
jgi:very-short-patch-repair endonuclease